MKPNINKIGLLAFFLTLGLASIPSIAQSQVVTREQIQLFLPSEQDLQGFTRIIPSGEPSGTAGSASEDKIVLAADMSSEQDGLLTIPGQPGHVTSIKRNFYTKDTFYNLEMTAWIYDNRETAKLIIQQFVRSCSARFLPGTFSSTTFLGESSWYNPNGNSTLICQYGQMVMLVSVLPTHQAAQHDNEPFPTVAIEAIVHQGLFHASQQATMIGVSTQSAPLVVNGHALPEDALLVAGQAYVPVAEFAKEMGYTSQWNNKTGALTLSGTGRKTVMLTADSTAASIGGVKATALTVPVLKQAGKPVMTLTDLLAVTGGRIVGKSGNSVQVKG